MNELDDVVEILVEAYAVWKFRDIMPEEYIADTIMGDYHGEPNSREQVFAHLHQEECILLKQRGLLSDDNLKYIHDRFCAKVVSIDWLREYGVKKSE